MCAVAAIIQHFLYGGHHSDPAAVGGGPGDPLGLYMYVCMHGHTYSKSMDQPGKVVNPARGQLNRVNKYFPVCVLA